MQSLRNVHGKSIHAGWIKPLATIVLLLLTVSVSLGSMTTYAAGGQAITVDLPVEMDTVKIDTEFYPDGEGGYLYAGFLDGYGVLETAIKFDISELSSNIHSAELSLHVSQHEAQSYLQFWGSEDNDWSEVVVGHGFPTSIDETGPIHTLDQQNGFGTGQHNIDVTDYVVDNQAGGDKATFVITGNDTVTSGNTLVYLYPRNTGLTDRVTYLRVTYTPQSDNADLSNLTLSTGTLDPAFGANTLSYTTSVGNEVSSIAVTPTVDDGAASVTVAGEPVVSGNASGAIVLDVGANWVPVEVTAEDGTLKTYTITVTRAQSSNADLSHLTLSAGSLDPVFSSNTTSYEVGVGNDVSSITVTPTTDDGVATVTVDGVGVVSGSASSPIALGPGDNPIPIVVTAQDGTTKTYTITVYDGEAPGIMSFTGPDNNATNQAFDVAVIFNEPVENFTTAGVAVSNGSAASVTEVAPDEFTVAIAPDNAGPGESYDITVQILAGAVQDLSGNDNEVSSVLTISFDTTDLTVTIASSEDPGPTNAPAFEVNISFNKPVWGFALGDISPANATLSGFTGSDGDSAFTVTVTPDADGVLTLDVAAGVAKDVAGNDNQEDVFTIESDRSAPEVVALELNMDPTPVNPGFTNAASFELQLQFSEPMADFDVAGLIVENASVVLFDEDNQQYFTLAVTADSVTDSAHTVSVEVPQGGFTDEAGNALGNSDTFAIEFGDVRPTAQFTTSTVDPTHQEPIAVTLTITEIFGEEVSGFDVSDIVTGNVAHIEWVGGTNPVFELEITPEGTGNFEITLSLPEGAVSDIAGNESEPSGEFNISVAHGLEPIPVPIAGPFGLVIMALLMLTLAARRRSLGVIP